MKLRRRTAVATTSSDLPFCGMCGTNMRVDAAAGRCALGHRVAAPGALAPAAPLATTDPTVVMEAPFEDTRPLVEPVADYAAEPVAGEGLYQAYQTADATTGRAVTWDDVVAPPTETSVTYDDYVTWDEPASGLSSLDMDTSELPVAQDEYSPAEAPAATPAAPGTTPVASDLLDELDDETYARRKAVGTIGATVAVSGAVFAAIAVLPF